MSFIQFVSYNKNQFQTVTIMSLPEKPNGEEDANYLNQIIDFRNGRYQGRADIYSRRPYGKGMFLDENYLFVLSDWVNGTASGKTFAIYPDNHLFYGSLLDGRAQKLCAYRQPGKFTIYLKHFINQNNLAIIDDFASQSLLILYLNEKQWAALPESERKNRALFIAAQWGKNKYIDVVDHKVYINEEQKWKIIQQFAKESVENEYRNYASFINSAFSANESSALVTYEDASEYELSYQGSSIVCKINKNEKTQEDYNVKLIGIYDENEQNFETYKKVKGKDKTEQFIKGYSVDVYQKRPKECLKKMREFYKRSTIFYNSYVKLSNFNEIRHLFIALSEYIDYFLANRYAQTFLYQNSNTLYHNQQCSSLKKINQAQLKEIQEEIWSSIRKKSSPQKKKIRNYCQSLYQNEEGVFARVKRYTRRQNREFLQNYHWMIEARTPSKSPSKRQLYIMRENEQQNIEVESIKSRKTLESKYQQGSNREEQIPQRTREKLDKGDYHNNALQPSSKKANLQAHNIAPQNHKSRFSQEKRQLQGHLTPPRTKLLVRQLKPLTEITSNLQENVHPPKRIKENLAQLTENLFSIESELKKQIHNTPKKYSKLSNVSTSRSPIIKQAPSPKASTKRSDRTKYTQKQSHIISSSPLQIKKPSKLSWR